MFWTTNLAASSPINNLLDEENVSLESILEQEDVLQECKLGNDKLIAFLTRPDIMSQLIKMVTTEPPEDINEKNRYRYANMACEVLSCEESQISETFASNPDLVSQLYNKLQCEEPLNPLLASFICKILFSVPQNSSKGSAVIPLLRDDCVTSLVNHIGTSAVMDLFFKSFAHPDAFDYVYVEFYHKQGLIGKLVALFKKDVDPAAQSNAAQFLCDLIRFSREQQTFYQEKAEPNPLLDEIESTPMISQLLNNMFETCTESCLVNGIQVLQALLEYQRYRANIPPKQSPIDSDIQFQTGDIEGIKQFVTSSVMVFPSEPSPPDQMTPLDIERLTKSVKQVHAAIVPRLSDFHSLLINPPPKKPVRTTIGLIEKPFGATRVEVVHLIRALLSSNNPEINRKLVELNTLPIFLDLFFEYPYNNFLHTQVEQSIKCILDNAKSSSPVVSPLSESRSSEGETTGSENKSEDESASELEAITLLVKQLIVDHNLIKRILDAYQSYQKDEKKCTPRPSYMGHIIKIANHVLSTKDVDVVKTCLDQISPETREEWNHWVEETLNKINLRLRLPLVEEERVFCEDTITPNVQLSIKADVDVSDLQQRTSSLCLDMTNSAPEVFLDSPKKEENDDDIDEVLTSPS